MKLVLLSLLCWSYIQLSGSFPIDEKPGFTPWKRALTPEFFSNPLGPTFGVSDEECRGQLLGDIGKCWKMSDVTVDKFIENRAEKTKSCQVPCLFYTSALSGAAEREANFVLKEALLTAAAEGKRNYQTIWDLHDPKFYPNDADLDQTPETKCIYNDFNKDDWKNKHDSCRRLYFKAMSKAMAMECSGEVFMMTNGNLQGGEGVPLDGIWWETEFPTLIDGKRKEAGKGEVTKITYLQVDKLTTEEIEALPEDEKKRPPKIKARAEYWPNGPGKAQLDIIRSQGNSKQKRSLTTSGLAKRADREPDEALELGDDGYPFPYSIDDIYKWYGDVTW